MPCCPFKKRYDAASSISFKQGSAEYSVVERSSLGPSITCVPGDSISKSGSERLSTVQPYAVESAQVVVMEKGCQSTEGTHDARHLCGPRASLQAVRPAALHCHVAPSNCGACAAAVASQQPSVLLLAVCTNCFALILPCRMSSSGPRSRARVHCRGMPYI